MEKTRKINKNKLKEVSFIFILFLIIIILTSFIRTTLSRYQSDADIALSDFDIAFWIVDNDLQSKDICIGNIYPNDNKTFDFNFSVSNFKNIVETDPNGEEIITTKRAETKIEYDIIIKATTNMPLNYTLYCDGSVCNTTEEIQLIDNVYYKVITASANNNPDNLIFGFENDETNNFTIKVNFPEHKDMIVDNTLTNVIIGENFADLVDDVNISIAARQKIN